jgi:hypothetical protein
MFLTFTKAAPIKKADRQGLCDWLVMCHALSPLKNEFLFTLGAGKCLAPWFRLQPVSHHPPLNRDHRSSKKRFFQGTGDLPSRGGY